MTALIYKAALPTYTSLADLNANAGESLLLNDAGTAYELEPGQSGATASFLVASYPQVGGVGDGTDHNPVLTKTGGVGTDITIDADTKTIHLAAGTYDFSLLYSVVPASAGGLFFVYLPGLSDPYQTLVTTALASAAACRNALTVQGIVLAAPAATKIDFYHEGGGAWTVQAGQVSIRKVA